MKKLFLGIAGAAVLSSCGAIGSASKVGTQQVSVANTHWVLDETVRGKTPTLDIEGERVSGNASCNNYFGSLKLDAATGAFAAGPLASTRMGCEYMETESRFLKTLEQANKYVVAGDKLELYKDKLLLLKFNKK